MYILFFIRTWQTNDHDSKKQTTLLYAIKHVIYNNGALAPVFGALVVKNTVMHKNPVTTATTPTHVWSDAQSQVLMQRQPNHTM